MKTHKPVIGGMFVIAACVSLTACGAGSADGGAGKEPSQDAMQAAALRFAMGPESVIVDKDRIGLRGKDGHQQILTLRKIACTTTDGAPGANCDFSVESCVGKAPDGCKPDKQTLSGRFVRSGDTWHYVPTNPMMTIPRPVENLRAIENAEMMASGGIAG
ncbi:hypothetical protein [Sphingomonas sp. VNH70]|uniref:hypothetical protein n=1 Tax=Sphingomonas silueang TaxID=3156617 RepID=UPI0032B4CFC3